MKKKKSIRDYGYVIGSGTPGKYNRITDVPGVKVGHCTVEENGHKTGVTAIIPCDGIVYEKKPVAAVYTLNGFGKTMGTIQIEELGVIETPILLTNTLNVGKVADALVEYTIEQMTSIGKQALSINAVVGETNDCHINPIMERAVCKQHVLQAIQDADIDFEQGAVGAGRGTICFGLKGGIGSSSRVLKFAGRDYTIGALVQSNFGATADLSICGNPEGERIAQSIASKSAEDKGSIMVILATDLPLTNRQLKRVCKRASVGLIRTGSYMGHGSGDVFIAFTNGNYMPDTASETFHTMQCIPETHINKVFRLAAETVEEAILNSMTYAQADTRIDGSTCHSLSEFLPKYLQERF